MGLLYQDESHSIIGACFEVYNELGNGFLINFGDLKNLIHERIINSSHHLLKISPQPKQKDE